MSKSQVVGYQLSKRKLTFLSISIKLLKVIAIEPGKFNRYSLYQFLIEITAGQLTVSDVIQYLTPQKCDLNH